MAMTDYPYPSEFLNPQPAWPVNVSCEAYDMEFPAAQNPDSNAILSAREVALLKAMRNSSNVYFNYTGNSPCTDYEDVDAAGNIAASGWNVLACN